MEEAIRIREWYFNVSYLELRSISLAAKIRGQRFNCSLLSYWKLTCITTFTANQTLMHGRWFSCAYCLWKVPTRRLHNCVNFSSFFGSSNNKMVSAGFMVLSVYLLIFDPPLFLEADCSPANAFILGDAWHRALAIAVAKCKLSELSDHKGFNYWNLFVGLDKKSALMKDGPDSTMSRDLGYR